MDGELGKNIVLIVNISFWDNLMWRLKLSLFLDHDVDQMEWMALAALLCIRRVRARPPITIVLKLLQDDLEVKKKGTPRARLDTWVGCKTTS
ncbi:hypothetical protein L1987_52362 [Smallanthus sonchifolius]|uniref:Uncharacterized protein n=1 Tax=Smallanthus sonchifolius TaxID=185202 RepID=A0ACB9ESK8_9ASTR|nr:hypothetical protein L1987_52362 [Smallanthus sonchifolius]